MFEDVLEGILLNGVEGTAMIEVALGASSGGIAGRYRNRWSSVLMRV